MNALEDTLFQQLAAVCSESRQAFDRHVGMSQIRRQLLLEPDVLTAQAKCQTDEYRHVIDRTSPRLIRLSGSTVSMR